MREHWVAVARGDADPDLVLTGGSVLSVFTGETFVADVAIADGFIVGVGDYHGSKQVDVSGHFLAPGFIDGHCHIESSKLTAAEFARSVVPLGTTSVVVDPHELANVLGTMGIEYMLSSSDNLPLDVYVMLPSCVPASPFESPLRPLEATDLAPFLEHPRVIGLAEMMNYPGAIATDPGLMAKMALTEFQRIDGHAPGVTGRDLNAYICSGPGSDHESTRLHEALEKKRLGMWVMIREASMIRNLVELLPLVRDFGDERCMFVTDDREAGTLLHEGHMNSMVRTATRYGIPPGVAVRPASLNVARWHGLHTLGAVAPGYRADIQVLPDLDEFLPVAVYRAGELVAAKGHCVPFPVPGIPVEVRTTMNAGPNATGMFEVPVQRGETIRLIELVRDQVVTTASTVAVRVVAGSLRAQPQSDIAKVAVVERHHATGRTGVAFVRGFGLKRGAFAATVAHDAHNVVVVGMADSDMMVCVERLQRMGGGMAVAAGGTVVNELALPIAGLMSDKSAHEVTNALESLEATLRALGVQVDNPFMYLGFLALSVIPELRITDRGLVDVESFSVVPLVIS